MTSIAHAICCFGNVINQNIYRIKTISVLLFALDDAISRENLLDVYALFTCQEGPLCMQEAN